MDSLALQRSVGYKVQDFCGNQRLSGLINSLTVSQVPDDDPEVKGTTVASSNAVVIDQSCGATNKLINHFSDWHQLRRAVLCFCRLRGHCRSDVRNVCGR